jgi:lipopolysaccharide export system protein LptA
VTTWQRRARLVAAVIGLACAVAVFAYSRGRPKPTPTPPLPARLSDPVATIEAKEGKVIRFDATGGKNGYTLQFAHGATYPDGHSRYDTVTLATSRQGRQFDIRADAAEERGKAVTGDNPGEVALTGHVRVVTSDGLEIHSDAATYEDASGVVKAPGRVSFTRDRMSGEGVGAVFNREQDLLSLLDQAHVITAPDKTGSGASDATARSMDLARTAKYIRLTDHAIIARDRETLASDAALIHLTDDEHGVTLIELRGHASVVPRTGVPKGPPEMRADTVTLGFHPDGHSLQRAALAGGASLVLKDETGSRTIAAPSIDIGLAPDGETLTHMDAGEGVVVTLPASAEVPARTIRALTLVAQGEAGHGLTGARFDGGAGPVEFTEMPQPTKPGQPAASRVAKSRSLALKLAGQLDAIEEAEFLQQVSFTDGDVKAVAERATYFATKGDLHLGPSDKPGQGHPQVVEGNVTVSGRAVRLNTATHDLEAEGEANTSMVPATEAGANHAPGLFEPGKLVLGTAPQLSYSNETQRATYVGTTAAPARVWQDQTQNVVTAGTIVLEQGTGNLTATGNVHSTFLLDSGGGTDASKASPAAPAATVASGKLMHYVDDERKASYVGDPGTPASLKGPDGAITAQMVDVYLARAERSLDHVVADGGVHYLQAVGGRDARGDHMTYDAKADQYTMRGRPAQAKLPSNDGKGCSLHTGTDLTFTPSGAMTASAHGANVTEREWPCADPVPVKK